MSIPRRVVFALEALLILLPVTAVSLWGSGFVLSSVIEKMSHMPITSTIFLVVVVLSLASLLALWLAITNQIIFSKSIVHKGLVKIPINIGAAIAVLSLLSLVSLILVPTSKDTTGALGLFAFGAPALIPYFHLMYVK